jgi:hypothetical protein
VAQRIKRFSVGQTAKVMGVLYTIVGLILAPFILIATRVAPEAYPYGPGVAIAVPIIYGCIGFIASAIGCAVYNLVAGWVGGIEVELV